MDLAAITLVASILSAGKIFYDLGSSAVKAVSDDGNEPNGTAPSQLAKVNGVNKANGANAATAAKGTSVDYDA